MQTLDKSNTDCDIEVSLSKIDTSTLRCNIKIRNKASNDLYFFNRIYTDTDSKGILNVSKNNFYAYVNTNDTLILAKAIIQVPEEFFVESEVYPCCSKILPGNILNEELKLDMPIQLYHPYVEESPNLREYPVNFQFGYFVGHEQTESMEIIVPSNEGELICFDPFDYNYQKIIEVGVFDPLPVSK